MTTKAKRQFGPIVAVRPRPGSDLEAINNAQKSKGEGMSDLVHSWASMFTNMVKEAEK